ncbi:MAG: phosphoenolpyruvate carboxylase [Candidatus Bathyarchaeota archaeon]
MIDGPNEDKKIPCTMSTQHPDNVHIPDWCDGDIIRGDAEIYEAYFAYKTLGCHEVMWDSDGKDVDTRVIRKLLSKHGDYFKEHVIGKDFFLTYRVPNPSLEAVEKKVLVETLQNITVAYDVASTFYKNEIAPIFEVILPFTRKGSELIRLYDYYKKAIVAVEDVELDGLIKVKDWVGHFKPKSIQVIPLIEDYDSILIIDRIVETYIDAIKPSTIRVFIARSDPALNYGLFSAVLLSKLALSKLKSLEKEREIPIYPILGVGSMPFRGHLSPENLEGFLSEYKGLSTVTIQSALKYDYPLERTKKVVSLLNNRLPNREPILIEPHEEKILLTTLHKFRQRYESIVEELAPLVNSIASYVPRRRERKLHIGLFGYSRNVRGVVLPRAIPFAAALYSLGMPPEFIGSKILNDLKEEEWGILERYYINMKNDLNTVGNYLSWKNINMLMDMYKKVAERAGMSGEKLKTVLTKLLDDLKTVEGSLGVKLGPKNTSQRKHENFSNNFLLSYLEGENSEAIKAYLETAKLRRCLG